MDAIAIFLAIYFMTQGAMSVINRTNKKDEVLSPWQRKKRSGMKSINR